MTLVTSPVRLDEMDDKLSPKFKVRPASVAAIRFKSENFADFVIPDFTLEIVADDPDDDRVLEPAVAGDTDCIVSGERHL